jgi:protocatechuate 3,4-dioxygenase beta subunit
MPRRYASSDDTHAMVARVAPLILKLLSDGLPRSRNEIVEALAPQHAKDEVKRTIKPGPYPWRNRLNDWRPAHIHYSIFGRAFVTRLITQLYFEGDPLLQHCPIYRSIPDEGARERLVATLDLGETIPLDTIAYRFDIVLRGRRQTPIENKLQGA